MSTFRKLKTDQFPFPARNSNRSSTNAARSSASSDYPSYVRSPHRTGFSAEAKKRAERHARNLPFRIRDGESKRAAARRWLSRLLARGPVYSGDVLDLGFIAGVPFRLLEQAKLELGVRFEPGNTSKFACWRLWWWALPEDDEDEEDEEEEEVGTYYPDDCCD